MSSRTSLQQMERTPWPAADSPARYGRAPFRPRRGWLALGVAVAVAFTSAGGYLAYLNTLPTAVTLNISNGQKEVPTDSRLELSFNRPVAIDALRSNLTIAPAIDGTLVSISGQNKFDWVHQEPFLDLTTYTLTLKPFPDTTEHEVKGARWTFTTTIVPRIVSVTGPDGSAITDGSEVMPGTPITFNFNDAMAPATVSLMLGQKPLTLAWAKDFRSASVSTQRIPSGPFVVTLAPGAKDLTGHAAKGFWILVTGLYYRDREHTTALRYPALIQIPNDALAVDQDGLQAADLVFEYLAEGGITRLTAIYDNAPDLIGPMRSSRLVSLKLAVKYRGLLFQSGESQVTQSAAGGSVPQFFDTVGYTFRTGDRYPPDNLMISGDAVNRAEAQFFPNLPAFTIPKARPSLTGGAAAPGCAVAEHDSTYSYDAIMGTYQKTEGGHRYIDPRTHLPLRIEMVIDMHTQETLLPIGDGHGSYIHDFNLDSGGSADIYYKGQHYIGAWSSTDSRGPLTFTLAGGHALTLPPGLVWIDLTS